MHVFLPPRSSQYAHLDAAPSLQHKAALLCGGDTVRETRRLMRSHCQLYARSAQQKGCTDEWCVQAGCPGVPTWLLLPACQRNTAGDRQGQQVCTESAAAFRHLLDRPPTLSVPPVGPSSASAYSQRAIREADTFAMQWRQSLPILLCYTCMLWWCPAEITARDAFARKAYLRRGQEL